MSKQQQAPGELEAVRAFVNTIDLETDAEQLDSPAALDDWLDQHALAGGVAGAPASQTDLRRARELREALRAVLLAHNTGGEVPAGVTQTLDRAASRGGVVLRFDRGGAAALEPEAPGVDGALGRLLAIVHDAIAAGTWQRLKACRDHTCAWAFYDRTKNRSGAWCNMAVCGNRAKARAYRERRSPRG